MTAEAWACARAQDFSWREYDDGCVLYDDASGDMSCLSPVAGRLLTLVLSGAAQTATQLAQALLDEEPQPDDVAMVVQTMQHFQSLSLVESVWL